MENKRRIWQVGELGTLVQRVIDNEPVFGNLWVRGEISNFKKHTAGHLYFSLKDNQASVRAVMFKSRAWSLNFTPTDGMDCLVRGYLSVYPRDTMLQLYVEEIIPAGVGLQHVLLEELKKRLGEKGYFATERKRPLPFLPRAVGVVTSPVGAAIRDIFQVIRRRYPGMPVIVYPALVQGEKAAPRVARGIEVLNDTAEVDVIIVARGGGSTEDLAVFNSEIVAEAFFTSQKPIISAIGHEIDVTIADLVADLRAPTPSAAAELVVPVKRELEKRIEKMREGLSQAVESRLEREKMRLAYLADAGVMKRPDRWLQGTRKDWTGRKNYWSSRCSHYTRRKYTSWESLPESCRP